VGLSVSETIGRKTLDFYYDLADRQVIVRKLESEGYLGSYQFRAKRADGTPIWVVVSSRPLMFRGEAVFLSGFYDITESKNEEYTLKRAREQLEQVILERTNELTAANIRLQQEIEDRRRAEAAQSEHLRFERMISDLSTRFVNLPLEDLDEEIGFALKRVVEFFGVDRGSLFQISGDQKQMQSVSTYTVEGATHVPKVSACDFFPYLWPRFLRGELISFTKTDELPKEASRDREGFEKLGVISNIAVPVIIGGDPKYVFSLGSTRKERSWDRELIPRIQLVAELLANASSRKLTELELQETELKYRTVADFTFDWEYWIDPNKSLIYASPACQRISGYRPEEFVKTPSLFRDIVLEEDKEIWDQHYSDAFKTLKPREIQFRIRTREGEVRWIEHACQPIKEPDGTFLGIRASNRDVTARQQAETALRESQEGLADAQRIAHLGNWKWDIVKNEVHWSPELFRVLDVEPQEMQPSKNSFLERLHPDDRPMLEESIAALMGKKEPFSIDHRIITSHGEVRFINSRARIECDDEGRPVRIYGTAQDITERKTSEDELRVKDSAIASSINAVGITDSEGTLIYVNDSCVRMWGYNNRHEMLGRALPEFWQGDRVFRTIQKLREEGGAIGEDIGKRKDGSLFPIQFSTSMIKDDAGRPLYMFGSFIDISERKKAESEISDRLRFEQLLAQISSEFVNLPTSRTQDAISTALDLVGTFLGVDRAALFERSSENAPFRCTHRWATQGSSQPPEQLCDLKALKWFQERLCEGEVIYVSEIDELSDEASDLRAFCGSLGIRSIIAVPLSVGGATLGAAVFIAGHHPRERSEELIQRLRLVGELLASAIARHRADEQLRLGEERYALASIAGRVGVWDWNLETNEIYVDPKLKAMLGFEDHEIQNHIDDWGSKVHPDDAELVMVEATNHLDGLTQRYEVEHRMIHKDGSIRWFLARGTAIRDENGKPYRVTGTDTDITEQKLAREAIVDLGGRLINAQEDERGRIARELHDDVSQRLALLAVDLELTGQSPPSTEEELAKRMLELSHRVKELSSDLHHLSYRLHPRSLERLGLSVAIKSLCREISEQQTIQIQFTENNVPETIPDDAALCLYRVAQESLQNVVKHSKAKSAQVMLEVESKNIRLVVSDGGVGFDVEEVRGRNGLGIISMRERLRAIEGRLTIRSQPDEGTHIEAFVPVDIQN
jgi:PAS domain S-box-containing protein